MQFRSFIEEKYRANILPTQTMHYYMENPSKIAIDLYEVWFPANLGHI